MAKKQAQAPAPVVEPVEEVKAPVVEAVEEVKNIEVTSDNTLKIETADSAVEVSLPTLAAPVAEKLVNVTPTGSVKKTEDGKTFHVETATVFVSTVENLKDLASKVNVRLGGTISQRGGVTVHTLLTDATGVQSLEALIAAVKAL